MKKEEEVKNGFFRSRKHSSVYRELLRPLCVGGLTGLSNAIILQPFDRIKTVMQDPSMTRESGFVETGKFVIKNHGILSLWRGTVISLVRVVPGVALYFGSIEWLKIAFAKEGKASDVQNFTFGAFGRCFAGAIVMPATVIKTRFESEFYDYKSVGSAIKDIYRTIGLRGYFSGFMATMLRDAPFSGIYLLIYRKQLNLIPDVYLQSGLSSVFVRFVPGFTAGIIACAITHPFDVVKTKVQLFPHQYPTFLQTSQLMYQESGLYGFCRGFLPRAIRRTFMTALSWAVFDQVLVLLLYYIRSNM